MRKVWIVLQTLEQRRDSGADRAGVDRAIGVSATNFAVYGAGVEAGSAANAAEEFAGFFAENLGAAVVEENDVELLRAIGFARLAGASDDGGVDGEWLSGRAAGEKLEKDGEVVELWDDFLDAHERDMDARYPDRKICVALIGTQYK